MTRPEWMTSERHPWLRTPLRRRTIGGLSPDAHRTARQRADLAAGRHPATGAGLLNSGWGYACRDCRHAHRATTGSRSVWKCALHRLGMSRSAASDIRVSWPACELFALDGQPVEVRHG